MFNNVPHSTTKWSPTSPKRENQSSLCTFIRLSPMCLYYLRSASLQALATLRRRHPPPLPPPANPLPHTSIRPRLSKLDVFGTSSVPEPDPAKLCSMFAAGGSPQEFHFVCKANYTPGFYIRGCRYFTTGQHGAWLFSYALFAPLFLHKNHYQCSDQCSNCIVHILEETIKTISDVWVKVCTWRIYT